MEDNRPGIREERQRHRSGWSPVLNKGLEWVVFPALSIAARLIIIQVLSLVGYVLLYYWLVPKALVREPLFFDYSAVPPVASVSLLSKEKQWQYIKDQMRPDGDDFRRFIRAGSRYSFEAEFLLAKSSRNLDLGKFMLHVTLFDVTGDAIAKSSRPVAIPYQSVPTLLLDAVTLFPLRLLGVFRTEEASVVHVNLMNNFREPATLPSTENVELKLSTAEVDIAAAYLTITPQLRGIT